MARKLMDWTFKKGNFTLTVTFLQTTETREFALTELFVNVDLAKMDNAELGTVVNGTKQKLADSVAPKEIDTDSLRIEKMERLWERMTVDRKWNLEKTGGGGGGVSKKKYNKVLYYAAKACWLNGQDAVAAAIELEEKLEVIKEIYSQIEAEENESEEEENLVS